MLQLSNQQMLAQAFSDLKEGLAIFDVNGEIVTANAQYEELLRRYNPREGAIFPFHDNVLNQIREHLQKEEHYATTITIDQHGHPAPNVFSGDTYDIRAQNVYDSNRTQRIGRSISIENSSEHARRSEMLDEFMHHRELILDHTDGGLVFVSPNFRVMWKRLRNLYHDHYDRMYTEGSICYENYGRTEPCEGCPLLEAMRTQKVVKEIHPKEDGIYIESIIIPVKKNDDIEGYILRLSDVTERESMIEALKLAKDNVIESERLEMAFLNNINHEVRTPLNAIIGFNDVLNGVTGQHLEEEERRAMKEHINRSADRLINLINDILDLSKMETGRMKIKKATVNLRDLCANGLKGIKEQLRPGVELRYDFPGILRRTNIYTDQQRVAQLLHNLLMNACKHTNKGHITLSVHTFAGANDCPMLRFSVTDTGAGIPADKIERLFVPFTKLHDNTQGLGMGLAICNQIAKLLDGRVYLDQKYYSGSRFVFEMPMNILPYEQT